VGRRRHELLDQLAPGVAARLGVGLAERDALPDRAAAVGDYHGQRRERRRLRDPVPFLGVEFALRRHRAPLSKGYG
jgi:hypothetical protein